MVMIDLGDPVGAREKLTVIAEQIRVTQMPDGEGIGVWLDSLLVQIEEVSNPLHGLHDGSVPIAFCGNILSHGPHPYVLSVYANAVGGSVDRWCPGIDSKYVRS